MAVKLLAALLVCLGAYLFDDYFGVSVLRLLAEFHVFQDLYLWYDDMRRCVQTTTRFKDFSQDKFFMGALWIAFLLNVLVGSLPLNAVRLLAEIYAFFRLNALCSVSA